MLAFSFLQKDGGRSCFCPRAWQPGFPRCCCCSIAESCLTLSDPMECNLPGSSVHGIFQARVLEWGAIAFSFKVKEWKVIFHATGNQKKVELDVLISDKTNLKPKMATRQRRLFSSVQFSRSVVSESLSPHESQHTRPPCHHQLWELSQTHVH